ncbi:hypothetical protein BV22DRAFT_1160019 [Leucogyrophana mollusca]|uniref:Uncharacterized protein n=1 Tax=Leucogyrophana mollusca TaxID=85980 RepID=A0ACB8BIT3_9AGAM|nr:hypothetical protein BV22DRAFT_1160019 [Leucogyrophana mollusca]
MTDLQDGGLFDDSDDDSNYDPFSSAHVSPFMYETDSDSDDNDTSPHAIQLANTRKLKDILTGNPATKVEAVLHYMNSLGLNLPIFLDLLSWGDHECITNAKIRYERTALMVSEELPSILERWHTPPRSKGSTDSRARAAKQPLEQFALSCTIKAVEAELEAVKDIMRCPEDDLSIDGLTSFFVEDMLLKLSTPGFGGTPKLWALLRCLTQTQRQRERNTSKNPDLMLTMFLRSQGISAKSLDLLHTFCLTMSQKWSVRAFSKMSANEMDKLCEMVRLLPFVISHDNVNIPFRVFTQRVNNQSHFDPRTAATVFFQPHAPPEPPLCNRTLQEYCREGKKTPLSIIEIYNLSQAAAPHQYLRDVHHILQYLVDSPEFEFSTYSQQNHVTFSSPEPVQKLPTGPEYITQQFMLGTVHIDEASYEGNDQLMLEFFRQMQLHTEDETKKTGLHRVIPWVGDQLTVERLRELFKFRAQDHNSYDRLDWIVVLFSWFYLQMAFANSLHKQYLGMNAGRGLMQAFTLLERKGLNSVQTRGPFHQNLHDAITHVAEAHFRACWKVVGGVENLQDLRHKDPNQLHAMAEQIVHELASSSAVDKIDLQPEDNRDQQFCHLVLWNHDVLRYLDLDESIRCGDVGVMEETLLHLAFCFAGGQNSKYTIEVLELLQSLHHEWPPEIKDFVRRRCWLMNLTGRPCDFFPIDKGQEHNIKSLKVTHRVQGPNMSWKLIKDISPAIPVLHAVQKHMEKQWLENSYTSAGVHVHEQGRRVRAKADEVTDIVTSGGIKLFSKKTMEKWWHNRNFTRATTEVW